MASVINRLSRRAFWRAKMLLRFIGGWLAVGALRALRLTSRTHTANLTGALLRRIGPLLPEHKIGRANLTAAFPEKSPEDIDRILNGVWDNLGRVAAEFPHLDRLRSQAPNQEGPFDIVFTPETVARFYEVRDGGPTLFFAAHLANWEVPALSAAYFDLEVHSLFRPPNVEAVRDAILKIRSKCMGTLVPSSFSAPIQLARALENGHCVGMLVDQHETKGTDVTFFGRTCKANPLLAQLARNFDVPIRGVRAVRLDDGNSFRFDCTAPLDLPRDAEGKIDVPRTMQAITSVVESWVREHPDQWLWLHRRWR